VSSEEEHAEALDSGWYDTPGEALNTVPTEADDIKAELEKLRAEKMLDSDREELAQLRKEKAEREEKKAKAKAAREEKTNSKTP
jgi:hypothetical protein